MEVQRLVLGVVDNEERRRAIVVLREPDSGRVLGQVDVHDDPAHLHRHHENHTLESLSYCSKVLLFAILLLEQQ